jgi:hypothetical protein
VDKGLWPYSSSFRTRPVTVKVEFPDCIKPSKLMDSTPIGCSFVELYSGSEEREYAETGKGGRGGEKDRRLIREELLSFGLEGPGRKYADNGNLKGGRGRDKDRPSIQGELY